MPPKKEHILYIYGMLMDMKMYIEKDYPIIYRLPDFNVIKDYG